MLRRSQADAAPRRRPRLRRPLAATGITGFFVSLMLLFTAPPAQADPAVCNLPGVSTVCDVVSGASSVASFVSDPFGFIAQKMGEGAKWFLTKVMDLLQASSKVDFTNPGFLKQYALIFAASAILTVVLWLIAVAKRAVRGVSVTTAVSEAIGLLALQVLVSAFTPAVLMLLNQVIDDLTKVFAGNAVDEGKKFIDLLTKAISSTQGSNAPSAMILIFLGIMVAALLVWIELLVRAGALYIGAALGPLVNSGLVDRDLWGRSKKWIGMLFALELSKPILFALFGLAASIVNSDTKTDSDSASTVLVGALMMFLAVFSSATLYKWVPSFGDDLAHLMHTRKAAAQAGPVAAIPGPVQASQQAMNARMMQSSIVGGSGAGAGAGAGGAAGAAGGPVAAAAMAAKAGMDIAKNKVNDAATIPDHGAGQGAGGEGGQDGSMPSTVPGSSGAGDSIVPTGTGAEAPAPADTAAPGTATAGTPTSGSIVATGTNTAATALGSTPAGEGAADTTGPSTGSSTLSGTATSNPSTPPVVPSQPGAATGSPSTGSPSGPGSGSGSSGQPSAAPTNPAGPSTVTTGTASPAPSPTAAQAPAPAAAPVPAAAPAGAPAPAPAPAAAAVATPPAPVPAPASPTAARTGTGAPAVQNTAPAPTPAQTAPAAGPAIPQGSDH